MSGDAQVLIEARDLVCEFEVRNPLTGWKTSVRALDGVNLKIRRGATLAVVGESGAGKSTLARCLALLERPQEGEVLYEGRDLLNGSRADIFAAHGEIQLILQDSASALNPRMTAAEIVAEPLVVRKIGRPRERFERARELMDRVELQSGCDVKRPFELSGGQRQRLGIARALSLDPKVLILDEALANLDFATQETITELLSDLQARRNVTLVHISHDLGLASRIAEEVAVMHAGGVVEHRPTRELFDRPEHAYARELLNAMPPIETILATRSA